MRYTLGRTGVMPSSSCSSCLRPDTLIVAAKSNTYTEQDPYPSSELDPYPSSELDPSDVTLRSPTAHHFVIF
jgi:hypothetical protein